ncbi:MAG: hypothetical protein K6U87_03305 [Firmicutes bacterium]|nr:hypothetical protein [Bacillota bacterium]
MVPGDLQASHQYWLRKRNQWAGWVSVTHESPLTTSQAISTYIKAQGRDGLIAELRRDNAALSGRICATVNHPDFDLATEVGLDVLSGSDPMASEALRILTDAIQALCASQRTQNVVAPLLVAGLFAFVIFLVSRG